MKDEKSRPSNRTDSVRCQSIFSFCWIYSRSLIEIVIRSSNIQELFHYVWMPLTGIPFCLIFFGYTLYLPLEIHGIPWQFFVRRTRVDAILGTFSNLALFLFELITDIFSCLFYILCAHAINKFE